MAKISDLPQELLEEILSRLPYKSSSRLKCVCKFWYSLLKSPIFPPPHLSHFIEHHSYNSVILGLSFPNTNFKLFSLPSKDASSAVDTLFPITDLSSGTRFQISGHCNGILCLSVGPRFGDNNPAMIVLYNPATTELKRLPGPVIQIGSSFTLAVALGHDSRSDDYKVLRMWTTKKYGWDFTNGLEEYSLSTDSWKPLCISNANDFRLEEGCFALFFKGTYYWWASRRHEYSSKMILGLNMGEEVFRTVSVPREVDEGHNGWRNLAEWRDSVSLICCYDFGAFGSLIDIWVMDGFGARVSWSKTHSIMSALVEPCPLVFWKGTELLVEAVMGGIKSCNVETREIKDLKIQGYEGPPQDLLVQAVNYVAALVPIKRKRSS